LYSNKKRDGVEEEKIFVSKREENFKQFEL